MSACGGGNSGGPSGGAPIITPSPSNISNFTETSTNVFLGSDGFVGGLSFRDATEDLTVTGGSSHESIRTGEGDDTVLGGGGNDTIYSSPGTDLLDGGAGIDTLSYGSSDVGVNVNFATNQVSGGYAQGDTISNFENLRGSGFADDLRGDHGANYIDGRIGDDIINGDGGGDLIYGDKGDDIIFGGNGDDVIIGGKGNDTLDGGSGNDTLSFGWVGVNDWEGLTGLSYLADAGIIVNLQTETVSGWQSDGDTINNFESVIGTRHADTITGSALDNDLVGRGGNDIIDGGDGDDLIYGDAKHQYAINYPELLGNDILNGGAGNDIIVGGDGADIINGGDGMDTLIGGAGNSTIADFDNDILNGGAGNDILRGLPGNDTLNGGADDDVLEDDYGTNILNGDSGDDTFKTWLSDGNTSINQMDGGTGEDILEIRTEDGYIIDLSLINAVNIEEIDVDDAGILQLEIQDVIDVTDGDNMLIISGSVNENVNSIAEGWVQGADQIISGGNYHSYTAGGATLLIDDDIIQMIS